MKVRKPKILWMGEATFLNTGYSVYGREVLNRLYSTGKYEIAELGCYGHFNDARRHDIPWTYYGNLPDTHAEDGAYNSQLQNQWGMWKFEQVLLDFRPDIVCDVRDWWMMEFCSRSPFRNMFHWAIMPTIDSSPILDQWLSTYLNADSVCTYSEYGRDELLSATSSRINFKGIAPPAADYNFLQPVPDKRKHKDAFGLEDDTLIVGTIMRNQKRKLYPDLIDAFKLFLNKYPTVGEKTFLYLHTAYPDIGWEIPLLIRESGIGHKILFTYVCDNCGHFFPSFFRDAVCTCPKCKKTTAHMPTTNKAISTEGLGIVLNCFDVYVQYATCEGFGMPQVEAAACGVPVMAVDYSAMSSVVRNLKGTPIKVERLFREAETHCKRAYPNNVDLADKLGRFLSMPEGERVRRSQETYVACRKNYSWDKTAKLWESIFDNVELRPHTETWDSPANIVQVSDDLRIPEGLSNEEFVRWCVHNIWCIPEMTNEYITLRIIRDLAYGQAQNGKGGVYYSEDTWLGSQRQYAQFNRQSVVSEMLRLRQHYNYWEQVRTGLIREANPRFILNAKREAQQ